MNFLDKLKNQYIIIIIIIIFIFKYIKIFISFIITLKMIYILKDIFFNIIYFFINKN